MLKRSSGRNELQENGRVYTVKNACKYTQKKLVRKATFFIKFYIVISC